MAPVHPRGLDRQGSIQAIGGIVIALIALIALLSSYDHISLPAGALQLPQQWGVWFIAASLALVVVDAQLATGSRLRAAHEAAEERERAARRARRQDRCALAQFEFQLHPNTTTRQRLADLISLLREYGEFA
ncbi:hypothetical protein KQ298_10430 [Synechococcus sp. CS-1330]|nr:hypothetical protein [Synechococcus sp. CS-1330]